MDNLPHGFATVVFFVIVVVVVIIPAALGGGESTEVLITGQYLFLSGSSGGRSWWGEDDANLDNACTKSVHGLFVLALADQVVIQLEAENDGGAIQALHVILRLNEHAVLIVSG